jgi:hypothetical protein
VGLSSSCYDYADDYDWKTMMDLIVIPSSGRPKRQQTALALQMSKLDQSYRCGVVVYEDEADAYKRMSYKGKRITGLEVFIVPEKFRGISRKREWILTRLAPKLGARYVAMLDDDLSFCHRPVIAKPDMPYINKDPYEMHHMIETLTTWLENGFVHVGLVARQANRKTDVKWQQPGRLMNAYAYNADKINDLIGRGRLELGRVPVMEDFDLTLQLLRLGYVNRISCRFGWTTTSNLKGGCSGYRTEKVQRLAAERLAELHGPFVQTVSRKAKTWKQGFTERIDVRVQWKKAYQSSLRTKDEPRQGRVPARQLSGERARPAKTLARA